MKQQLKIVLALVFLFSINVSFAGTDNKPKKSQEQEQQTLQTGQKGEIDQQQLEDGADSYEAAEPEVTEEPAEVDSVEDDSVSKYNFIFYFLYKFKYEAEA